MGQAMPSQRPSVLPALVLWACAFCAWFTVRHSGAAFTVTGASPHGFPPPAQSPRAEIPAGHEAGALGGAKAADDAEVMFTRFEYLRRKDMGYKFPAGQEAYQFPPPIPSRYAGQSLPSWRKSHRDRVYKKKYIQCQRLQENKRRRSDCEYDAFRWRRTCYWKTRPHNLKTHPDFNENHPWRTEGKQA